MEHTEQFSPKQIEAEGDAEPKKSIRKRIRPRQISETVKQSLDVENGSDKEDDERENHPERTNSVRSGLSGLVRKVSCRMSTRDKDPPSRRRGTRRTRRSVRRGTSIKRSRSVRRPNVPQITVDVEKGTIVTRKPNNINTILLNGYRRFLLLLGIQSSSAEVKQTVTTIEPAVLEELEAPQRYRPENINSLCEATGFTRLEMKRMYRGFKSECPQGLVTEEVFHTIFNKFFPLGANMSAYSHYVFSALDVQETGVITFQDFALGLSILVKGTQEDKLRWTFDLYDLNGDGVITKDEMEDIIASVYDLMGRPEKETKGVPEIDEFVTQRVNKVFQRMDLNGDGSVSFEEFLESCLEDDQVSGSLASCTNVVI